MTVAVGERSASIGAALAIARGVMGVISRIGFFNAALNRIPSPMIVNQYFFA
jgi:hypothetical protein